MNTNFPIGGLNVSKGTDKISVDRVTNDTTNSSGLDQIQTSKELKQAQLEGKNIPISEEQLLKAIDRAIKAVEGTSTMLDFSVHEKKRNNS